MAVLILRALSFKHSIVCPLILHPQPTLTPDPAYKQLLFFLKHGSGFDLTHRNDVWCVEVDDALDVGPGLVDGAVQHEARLVHSEVGGALLHGLALHVDLHQARGRHLAVQHPERVQQEMFRVLAHAGLKNIFFYSRRHLILYLVEMSLKLTVTWL